MGVVLQAHQLHTSITTTKCPSFCMTTISTSLTNPTAVLPQSRDCSCYVSRPILAYPPLWLQKHTDLRAHYFAHSPGLWHRPSLANDTYAWSWGLCGIYPSIHASCFNYGLLEGKIRAFNEYPLEKRLSQFSWKSEWFVGTWSGDIQTERSCMLVTWFHYLLF